MNVVDPVVAQTLPPVEAALRLAGFGVGALVVAGAVAAGYRWYSKRRVPGGVAVLAGAAVVALYLQTAGLYDDVLAGTGISVFQPATVAFNLLAMLTGVIAAVVGWRLGDRVAAHLFAFAGVRELESGVGRATTVFGRVTTLTLPDEIETMEGYDPVRETTLTELAGQTLLFPRRLSPNERRDRLAARLKQDYDVGAVDVEVDDEGEVRYLAVGSRPAGVGPTLAPGVVAVALRADPPAGASPGDVVQVWGGVDTGSPTRVATGELRAVDDDVVTVALDETDSESIDPAATHRLVTVPATPRAERALAAAVRAADETLGAVTVAAGSDLDGRTVGDVDAAVVGVRPADGTVEAVPSRDRRLGAGDTVYVVARPDTLRRLESRGQPAEPAA